MSEAKHLSLRSVNHISKVCSCLAASVAFYRDVLGFIVVKRPSSFDQSFEGCWCAPRAASPRLQLAVYRT